jgi:hypothetical protein
MAIIWLTDFLQWNWQRRLAGLHLFFFGSYNTERRERSRRVFSGLDSYSRQEREGGGNTSITTMRSGQIGNVRYVSRD